MIINVYKPAASTSWISLVMPSYHFGIFLYIIVNNKTFKILISDNLADQEKSLAEIRLAMKDFLKTTPGVEKPVARTQVATSCFALHALSRGRGVPDEARDAYQAARGQLRRALCWPPDRTYLEPRR